jgi:hypothetical protein
LQSKGKKMEKSNGHLFFKDGFEYFALGLRVYKVAVKSQKNDLGYRRGADFECYRNRLENLKKVLGV